MKKLLIKLFVGAIFAISFTANFYFAYKIFDYYKSLNLLRLDPLETLKKKERNRLGDFDKKNPMIIFFGDSRIAQWHPEPYLPKFKLVNKGIGGQTTAQLRLRLEEDVLAYDPDIVVLQAGINDLKAIGLFPKKYDIIVKRCKENINHIIDAFKKRDIPVVVLTIFPAGKPNFIRSWIWSEDIETAIKDINNEIISYKEKDIHVIDTEKILAGKHYLKRVYQKDMLHINGRGYEALNQRLQPYISQTVLN